MSGYYPPWSKNDLNFLRKNYKEMTAREISKKLNKSVHAVKHMRRKFDLKKGPRYRWPTEKVTKKYNSIIKNSKKTPTYVYLETNYPGLLTAIHRDYGNYNNFLMSMGIRPNFVPNIWNRKKCISRFKDIMKERDYIDPPPIKELDKIHPGILKAIYNHWGSYKTMLKQVGLHPNFEKKWNRNKCDIEFKEMRKKTKDTPTADMIRELRPDLLAAIIKYYGKYNTFLTMKGLKHNQQSWTKKRCISEFQKLMEKEKRTNQFFLDELYEKNSKLVGAIYRHFNSYNDFVIKLGFKPNCGFNEDKWIFWEKFVVDACKEIYNDYDVNIKNVLPNRKLPDITIQKNGNILKIVDAKTDVLCKSIKNDIENYKPFCEVLEFWCLAGKRRNPSKNIKFLTADQIKDLLERNKSYKLLKELSKFEDGSYVK